MKAIIRLLALCAILVMLFYLITGTTRSSAVSSSFRGYTSHLRVPFAHTGEPTQANIAPEYAASADKETADILAAMRYDRFELERPSLREQDFDVPKRPAKFGNLPQATAFRLSEALRGPSTSSSPASSPSAAAPLPPSSAHRNRPYPAVKEPNRSRLATTSSPAAARTRPAAVPIYPWRGERSTGFVTSTRKALKPTASARGPHIALYM